MSYRLEVGSFASAASRRLGRAFPQDPDLRMNVLAIVIGVIAGIGAVFFRVTIWVAQEVFYSKSLNPGNVEFHLISSPNLFSILAPLGALRFVLLPALGGLFVGFIIVKTTRKVSGHGVPKVLEAILTRGGQIDPKIAIYKTVASSIAIGSGGSLGREGPIVQIGSASGAYFGRFVDRKSYTRTLVAAGAAGGIAATFNAPLAGVMFALEILLAEYYLRNVIAVVLSAVVATAIARPLLDFTPSPGVRQFLVPVNYQLVRPEVELPLYVLLGVVIAFGGAAMVKLLYAVEHGFERLDVPFYYKPAAGGALLGLSTLFTVELLDVDPIQAATWLFGVGYDTIGSSIEGNLVLAVLLVLGVMKLVGFSLSVGSGSSGGVFSPALFIGSMFGGAFGLLAHGALPNVAPAGAYALVAMGGMFAASARAPLTATLIIFELTGQYSIILPLLMVCVIGSEISQRLLDGGTIYSQKLRDKGLTVQERRIGSLEDLTAEDVMTHDVGTLLVGTSIEDAVEIFRETQYHGMPIVEDDDTLVGILTLTDLEPVLSDSLAANEGTLAGSLKQEVAAPVEALGTTALVTATTDTNLLSIVDKMERRGVSRIPVVDDHGKLQGLITESDILDAYDSSF